jgi:preprotein translocase subunit Sss1
MSHSPTNPSGYDANADKAADLVRNAAKAVGAVFLLVGILGFVPGITQDIYPLNLFNHEPDNRHALLLGLFEVSVLHNIVHLLFGVAGLAMAKNYKSATSYLIGGGVIYLVLTVYGLIVNGDHTSAANFVPINGHDNWLHALLGVGMIALGLIGSRAAKGDRTGAASPR